MRFLVDRNIPLVRSAFQSLGDVEEVETSAITPQAVRACDVLVVRSETRVGRSLLEGSRVRFVATATIGTDHIDTDYLKNGKIAFASAPGCNSNAVKEYVVAALLHCSSVLGWRVKGKSLGVVGVGNVGSKVAAAAEALGMRVLLNDPPLARAGRGEGFVALKDLLNADAITLHVPLTRSGEDATFHHFDAGTFSAVKEGVLFINTSRGGVADTPALARAIATKQLSHTILDVWENEPSIDVALLKECTIGTPHIAGYSLDGRVNAVRIVREAVCRHFEIDSSWDPALPSPPKTELEVDARPGHEEDVLHRIVRQCYNIASDDERLRHAAGLPAEAVGEYFAHLRRDYRIRREFQNVTVHLPPPHAGIAETLRAIGFRCILEKSSPAVRQ